MNATWPVRLKSHCKTWLLATLPLWYSQIDSDFSDSTPCGRNFTNIYVHPNNVLKFTYAKFGHVWMLLWYYIGFCAKKCDSAQFQNSLINRKCEKVRFFWVVWRWCGPEFMKFGWTVLGTNISFTFHFFLMMENLAARNRSGLLFWYRTFQAFMGKSKFSKIPYRARNMSRNVNTLIVAPSERVLFGEIPTRVWTCLPSFVLVGLIVVEDYYSFLFLP